MSRTLLKNPSRDAVNSKRAYAHRQFVVFPPVDVVCLTV